MPLKQKHKNNLFLMRKKIGLEQKQVALILGHKTTNQISRYERGAKLPNLKTALKLGIIYRLPVHILLSGFYADCLKEIAKQKEIWSYDSSKLLEPALFGEMEYCTFAEKLKPFHVSKSDLDKVGSHIAKLVRERGEKSDHFTTRK